MSAPAQKTGDVKTEQTPLLDEPRNDWRQTNESIFMDNRTFSSLAEMQGSLLEACCPGDGILSGALSLITTAATPTMLSMPLAFAVGGWPFAFACMVSCICITFISVRILAVASVSADSDDYETVAGFFLGKRGRWVARVVLFIYNFGAAVVYLGFIRESILPVLTGKCDFLPMWMRGEWGSIIFLMLAMIVIIPLTFNSRLASIRTNGFISNIFVIFIIGSIGYRYMVPVASSALPVTVPTNVAAAETTSSSKSGTSVLMLMIPYMFVAPIFIFSYEVQSNVMGVIKDLHDRTGHKILVSIVLALAVISCFYLALGIFGSLSFPNIKEGNILSLYDVKDDWLMATCQLFCCYSAAVSYVFCIFPCRLAAFMFVSDGQKTKIPKKMRVKLGLVLGLVATFFAIFLPDVAQVVSVLGAIFSSTLSMTFPALFALKMRSAGTYLTARWDGVLSWMLLCLGIMFSLVGTFMAVFFSSV